MGSAAVGEEQVVVSDSRRRESCRIIQLVIEANDDRDVVTLEVRQIGLRRVLRVVVDDPALRMRTGERQELARYDPVQVSVLQLQPAIRPSIHLFR